MCTRSPGHSFFQTDSRSGGRNKGSSEVKVKHSNSLSERNSGTYLPAASVYPWSPPPPSPSDERADRKLFHASTTTLCDTKLRRTSSYLSGSVGSSRCSQSSLSSQHDVMGSGTLNSVNGTYIETIYHSAPMAGVSKTAACHGHSAVSSSSSEWEREATAYGNSCSATSRASTSSGSSDLIRFSGSEATKDPNEVAPLLRNEKSKKKRTTSFSEAAMMHASCPTLNVVGNRQNPFQRTLREKSGQSAVSSMNIGQNPSGIKGKSLGASMSTGCISLIHMRSLQSNLKRPITLRFAPSGLTESNKVVWMSDTGNHTGVVKWVGKIRDDYYAGVEFEKPIGNSSGIYGYGYGLQARLFTCKLGYGRFIPISQLILYEDFYENEKTGFICIICRDDFIEPGQSIDMKVHEKVMVATKCGHLFHQMCLNQWFNEKPSKFQQCPYCQLPMDRNDTIRIFPAQLK